MSEQPRASVWGDAAQLIDIVDVRRESDLRFVSVTRSDTGESAHRNVVEASQMLGQALVAGARHTPGRRMVSGQMVFFRPADTQLPLLFELTELSSGRTLTALGVQVSQKEKPRAAGTLLLDATSADVVRHAVPAPHCPGPGDCVPYDMGVVGREIRVADAAYTDDPQAPAGPPVIDAWVRFAEVPDDPPLHAALLAQFTGHMSLAAALRPHAGIGQSEAHRTLSMGINAISLSLHADVHADRWLRYHHHSTYAGDGMTHAECRVYTEPGDLVASFTVDAMLRRFRAGGQAVDPRTAL